MASAELGGHIAFVAAALSAMTDKEIVTKEEYDVREKLANSGIGPSYTFKGRLDVPRLIEQTYADAQKLFPERRSPIDVIVREEITRETRRQVNPEPVQRVVEGKKGSNGFWGPLFGAALGVTAAVATVVTAPVSVPFLVGSGLVVVGAAGGAIAGAAGATKKVKEDSTNINQTSRFQVITSSSDGRERFLTMSSDRCTILQLKDRIREEFRIRPEDQCLSFHGIPLDDTSTLANYNIRNNSVIKLSVRVKGGSSEIFYLDDTNLDPTWDYDFTDIDDGDTEFMRGGHRYYRPCGWKRIAINVLKKYPDGEAWLGHDGSAGEWAVTYHGTKKRYFNPICEGYKIGDRELYGKGVYSASRIGVAEDFAKKFQHDGSWYIGVFQNRVNPDEMCIPDAKPDYRLCQDENSIRPYGLCVKKF